MFQGRLSEASSLRGLGQVPTVLDSDSSVWTVYVRWCGGSVYACSLWVTMALGFRLCVSCTVHHRSIAGTRFIGRLNIRCTTSVYIDDVGFV